jgi:hypothetical protein
MYVTRCCHGTAIFNVYEYLVLCRDSDGGLSLHTRKAETLQRPSKVDARMARDK